ncbi:6-carboxytetrahydropterin synthase QueD [Megalodesulfovibrio paquesii]
MTDTWRLSVTRDFAAGHALRHYQGKCEQLHGHNFSVQVVVEGQTLDPTVEILMDFGDLKRCTDQVLAALDHRNLNEVPPFDQLNPSSENLARSIFQNLAPLLTAYPVRLVSVTVCEKPGQCASYSPAGQF